MNKKILDKKKTDFNTRIRVLVVAAVVATTIMNLSNVSSFLYSTSILTLPAHAPFDGTVYPIKKVPNWSKLTAEQRLLPYNQLPSNLLIDIPYYDASQLSVKTDTLKWGNVVDDVVRNAKITYSTPYLGDYKLDGLENAGSHPATDIKVPMGTPIYAIANGVVSVSSTRSDGFGHHIVLQHNNFPSLDDPSKKITIYSSYSHLSDVLVNVGDVVTKGQQIALSGKTGTATTPHVHFQIDMADAPFHPYWPFTYTEASAAGLDFFTAVNAALGQDNAKKLTINPVAYVQKYLKASADTNVVTTATTAVAVPATVTPDVVATSAVPVDKPLIVADATTPVVVATNTTADVSKDVPADTAVDTTTTAPVSSTATDETPVTPVVADPVTTTSNTSTTQANTVNIPDKVIDNVTFRDVALVNIHYDAITYLADRGIIKGYPDGTFKPNQTVSRAEAIKIILQGISAAVENGTLTFKDIDKSAWYTSYLYTALKRGIVSGFPDNTFKPDGKVTKAEFLKILFTGLAVDVDPHVVSRPYADVQVTDWFAPYIAYAKELKILDSSAYKIYPTLSMTRAEVAEAMYRLMTASK